MTRYRLRNGIICHPSGRAGWVHVVSKPRSVQLQLADVLLLRHGSDNPLDWTGGAFGEGFDVIRKIETRKKAKKTKTVRCKPMGNVILILKPAIKGRTPWEVAQIPTEMGYFIRNRCTELFHSHYRLFQQVNVSHLPMRLAITRGIRDAA